MDGRAGVVGIGRVKSHRTNKTSGHLENMPGRRYGQAAMASRPDELTVLKALGDETRYAMYRELAPNLLGWKLVKKAQAFVRPIAGGGQRIIIDVVDYKPEYRTMKGWQTSIAGITSFDDLPQRAKDYVRFLEDQIECHVSIISTGPRREETILRG